MASLDAVADRCLGPAFHVAYHCGLLCHQTSQPLWLGEAVRRRKPQTRFHTEMTQEKLHLTFINSHLVLSSCKDCNADQTSTFRSNFFLVTAVKDITPKQSVTRAYKL